MKDLKLTTLALTTTVLIASNLIIGVQYKDDVTKYEAKLHNQYKLIQQYKIDKQKEEQQLSSNQSQINNLNTQLDQVKKENDELKKQLEIRKEMNSKRKLTIEASAYVSSCRGCSGKTFTGYDVNNTIEYNGYRIIAADLSIISLYSIVRIETQNETFDAIVIDTGGKIRGHKIDLLVRSYQEAIQFGRQNVTITILKEENGDNDK